MNADELRGVVADVTNAVLGRPTTPDTAAGCPVSPDDPQTRATPPGGDMGG